MYRYHEEDEFPNWWDVLDESEQDRAGTSSADLQEDGSREIDWEMSVGVQEGVVLTSDGLEEAGGSWIEPEQSEYPNRVSESSNSGGLEYSAPSLRGYEREVIENVWAFAEIVPGNDPDLWRKDEWGNWIRRIDYGRRDSEFGWEIFDPGVGRHSQGVYAMRPMQWSRFLEQYEVLG